MNADEYLDALLSLPGMYGALPSRDGRWVAWSWMRTAPTAEVYAAPTDGSQAPIRLTDTPENTFAINWTPDGKAVLVVQDHQGDERRQLFRVDLDDPLNMKPLTEPNPNYFMRGAEPHPNGRWLFYGANFDVESGDEIEQTWLYRHDLETGERVPLAKPQKNGFTWPELNSIGTHLLYPRSDLHPAGDQMWVVDVDGHQDRELLNFGDEVKTSATWFPDGKRILALVETPTHRRLGVLTLDEPEPRWLVDDPARNIEHAFVPHGSNSIVLIEVDKARTRCVLLNPDTGEEIRMPELPGRLVPVAPVDGQTWIGTYHNSRQPNDIFRFAIRDVDPTNFVSLSRVWERTALTPDDLTAAEDVRWTSVDGLEIQGWLYRAQGEPRGTVVYIHGGPTAHSSDSINNQIQFFAREGFNVLDPNYRGSTGFGMAFREAIKVEGWGGKEQDDIATGIQALIDAGIAQAGQVGMTGTSYGGYSSWCSITRLKKDVLAASAPVCGMTDLVVDYETTRPDLRPYSEEMMGGRPDQVPERYHERSPINFVDQIEGRLLIVQGMRDPNVTPENVRTVTEALQKSGVKYELLAFDDEGHGISRPKNQKVLYKRLHEFFASAFS
jgi:dipeptidyl aminopeptidase/acylaminoacyl peptidase